MKGLNMGNNDNVSEISDYNAARNYEMFAKIVRLEEKVADLEIEQHKLLSKIEDNEAFKMQMRGAGWLLASALTLAAAAASIGRTIEGWFK